MTNATPHTSEQRELAALMKSRAHVYDLIAHIFETEVDEAFACELSDAFEFESDDEALRASMEALRSAVRDADESAIEQLAVVFDRMFFGMGPRTAQKAFPYESVYTSDRGIMMQEAYSQVTSLYRSLSLRKDEKFTEPEDHLSVECAFMSIMARTAAEALENGDEKTATRAVEQQHAFLNEHLLNWTPRFCADLRKGTEGGFYYHAADFSERFFAIDADMLGEMLDDEGGGQ